MTAEEANMISYGNTAFSVLGDSGTIGAAYVHDYLRDPEELRDETPRQTVRRLAFLREQCLISVQDVVDLLPLVQSAAGRTG